MDVNSIVTKKDLNELWEKISKLFGQKTSNEATPEKKTSKRGYLRSRDVRTLLSVSDNRLRDMRNNREIPFTTVGKTYYYPEKEIHDMMDNNMRNPNA